MATITFNLSKTSRAPGWDPSLAEHDAFWDTFAAGYSYSIVGGNGQVFDSLRASDPATRGSSDTFNSTAGSLDLKANNFAGNVSLDWLDGGATARLALDSAWNTIKNAYVSGFTGQTLILENWVDAWVWLENDFNQEVRVDGAKRGEIITGSGDDTVWIGVDSNNSDWTNHITVTTGDGDDHITLTVSTHDYSLASFATVYNPRWTKSAIDTGDGDDVIDGGGGDDTVDGGTGIDDFMLQGTRAQYDVTTVDGVTTVRDLRTGAANHDGIDVLRNVERLHFSDQVLTIGSGPGGHGTGVIEGEVSFDGPIGSETPFVFTSSIDFEDDPYDASDFGELSPGAQEIVTDGNAGGSSLMSEVFSFEVLARTSGAVLVHTEGEIAYDAPGAKTIDYTAQIDGEVFGVMVTRAVAFPLGQPLTTEAAFDLISNKLDDIVEATQHVSAGDAWSEAILHVIAIDDQAVDAVLAAYEMVDADTRADTTLLITRSDGADQFLYFNL